MILDLSYMFTIDGIPWPSVNDSTTSPNVPLHSMAQLGQVLPRLVHAIATSPEDQGPWVFMKLDIKDGFWRLMVPETDEHNFCYVLPQEDPMLCTNSNCCATFPCKWDGQKPHHIFHLPLKHHEM